MRLFKSFELHLESAGPMLVLGCGLATLVFGPGYAASSLNNNGIGGGNISIEQSTPADNQGLSKPKRRDTKFGAGSPGQLDQENSRAKRGRERSGPTQSAGPTGLQRQMGMQGVQQVTMPQMQQTHQSHQSQQQMQQQNQSMQQQLNVQGVQQGVQLNLQQRQQQQTQQQSQQPSLNQQLNTPLVGPQSMQLNLQQRQQQQQIQQQSQQPSLNQQLNTQGVGLVSPHMPGPNEMKSR